MLIQEIMNEKKITVYGLAKMSGVPRSTINDIYHGRAQLEKCTAETIYKIAKSPGVSMEMIDCAVKELYGGWEDIPQESKAFIEKAMKQGDFLDVYASIRNDEKETREILVEFEQDYPKVIKESNLNDILRTLKKKMEE